MDMASQGPKPRPTAHLGLERLVKREVPLPLTLEIVEGARATDELTRVKKPSSGAQASWPPVRALQRTPVPRTFRIDRPDR